ncbi:transporter substrate-binding domain-containing protein [Kiloniella laminariae]|uniref:Transporter substrate-binding domain-containing protein n=1 Tax=Kiloniella laminariae TaxID=454162 RepID=A0ABT4LFN6_9PROT|nr:transporter substrate-binding domain-containing protein [Kiloniella laminariae]MCZ4279750.1 transporter substrate-binding domain-containing protein [Kiloniella laminariae]
MIRTAESGIFQKNREMTKTGSQPGKLFFGVLALFSLFLFLSAAVSAQQTAPDPSAQTSPQISPQTSPQISPQISGTDPAHGSETHPLQITVGEWPPYISEKLDHHGAVAHLISDIFAAEGIPVELIFLPWGRAYSEAANGNFVATGVWMHKAEREADFLYSEPVLNEEFVFFHRADMPFDWQDFSELTDQRMGGGIKYSYGPGLDAYLDSGQIYMDRLPTDRQNFEKLLAGRISLYPQEVNVGYAALRENFPPEVQKLITHHPRPVLVNLSYVLFPKSLPDSVALRDRFNTRLQMFRNSGLYDVYMDALKDGRYM